MGKDKKQPDNLVEVTRSFSYKVNLGNYQTADFFCSQKVEVLESEAEKKSEELYTFCKNEVVKSIVRFLGSDIDEIGREVESWKNDKKAIASKPSQEKDLPIS